MAFISVTLGDYIIFFLFITVSLGIGLFFACRGGRRTSTEEYFLGGRKLHYLPVAVSLIVSFQSSVLMMGTPAEVYIYGLSHVLTLLGDLPCILLINAISVPLFYKMRLTSIFQYVRIRFAEGYEVLRLFLVFLGMLFTIIYNGLVFLGPAYAIQALTGLPVWVTVVGSAVVAVVYTSIGGMKAVIWTDMFQFLVMLSGMLAVFIRGTAAVGGFHNVWDISKRYGRTETFDFNPDPWVRHTFWSLVIGSFVRQMLLLFNQQTMQRLNSTKSAADARKVVLIFIPFVAVMQLVADGTGLVAFSYYAQGGCDPLESGRLSNPNQIFVALMSDLFQHVPGVAGLVTAALLGASLSSLSSNLNGLAANTCEEFLKYRTISEKTHTILAKLSVVVYGILATLIALSMTFVRGSLSQIFISILGSVGAPMVGIFLLAIFTRTLSAHSVVLGGVAGLAVSMWMSVGYNFSTTLPETPWLPPGPTSRCPHLHVSQFINDTSSASAGHGSPSGNSSTMTEVAVTYTYVTATSVTVDDSHVTSYGSGTSMSAYVSTIAPQSNNTTDSFSNMTIQGLDRLYTISYQYFSVISTLITVIVGLLFNTWLGRYSSPAEDGTIVTCQTLCSCCSDTGKRKKSNYSLANANAI